LHSNCLLREVIEGKIKGGIEMTGRWGRRCRKLLDDLKEGRGYSHLKEEALDYTMWRAHFGRTKWMNTLITVVLLYMLEVCFIRKFKGYLKHNFCIHRYNNRGNINLHMPNCYTALFQKSVVNMGVKLYSSLPERIKTLTDFKCFKNK
jgi:hypothetical protein